MAPGRHPGSDRRHKEERRPDVAGEHLVERRDVELSRWPEECNPGVVDPEVDPAEARLDGRGERGDRRRVADVEPVGHHVWPVGEDRVGAGA